MWLTTIGSDGAVFPEERIEAPSQGKRSWKRRINLRGRPIGATFSLALMLVGDSAEQQIESPSPATAVDGIHDVAERQRPIDEVDMRLQRCEHPPILARAIPGEAQITSIASDAEVTRHIKFLTGTYRPPGPSRVRLWILVYAPDVDRYYPQTHHARDYTGDLSASLLSNGRFRSAARFDVPGVRYEVIAVLADTTASRMLADALRRSRSGIVARDLPVGLDEKDCLPVRLHRP